MAERSKHDQEQGRPLKEKVARISYVGLLNIGQSNSLLEATFLRNAQRVVPLLICIASD